MNDLGYKELEEYIIEHYRYGSVVNLLELNDLIARYGVTDEQREDLKKLLKELSIDVKYSKKQLITKFRSLLEPLGEQKVIENDYFDSWCKKENISKDLRNIIKETLISDSYIFEDNVSSGKFYQDIDIDNFDDLDVLFEDDNFQNELDELEDVVSIENNIDYIKQFQSDFSDADIKERSLNNLIKANYGLIWKFVRHYSKLSTVAFDEEDMYQAGVTGLLKAAERFDISKGNTFSTYATHWIRQAISRGIADYSTLIRIPVHMREKLVKLIKVENEFYLEYDRNPTENELSTIMEIPVNDIYDLKVYKNLSNLISLDQTINDEDDSKFGYFIEDKTTLMPDQEVECDDLKLQIRKILEEYLTFRQKEIIILRFGLDDSKQHTLEEIGSEFGVTRERIRQIENKAIKKLSNCKKVKERLDDYFYEN